MAADYPDFSTLLYVRNFLDKIVRTKKQVTIRKVVKVLFI